MCNYYGARVYSKRTIELYDLEGFERIYSIQKFISKAALQRWLRDNKDTEQISRPEINCILRKLGYTLSDMQPHIDIVNEDLEMEF